MSPLHDEFPRLWPSTGQDPIDQACQLVTYQWRNGISDVPVHVADAASELIGRWKAVENGHLPNRAETVLLWMCVTAVADVWDAGIKAHMAAHRVTMGGYGKPRRR